MTAETNERSRPAFVEAPLKYLADAGGVPVYIPSMGGGDATLHEGRYVMQPVPIHDARARAEGFSLDREGFVLVTQASAVGDFYEDEEIAAVYDSEVQALVRRVTGAERVEIFDHTRRAASLKVQVARLIRDNVASKFQAEERTFGTVPAAMRYFSRMPDTIPSAIAHLMKVRRFPMHLAEPRPRPQPRAAA